MKLVPDNPEQLNFGIEMLEILDRRHITMKKFAKYYGKSMNYVMNAYYQAMTFKHVKPYEKRCREKRGVQFVPVPNNLPEPSFMANAQTTLQEPEFMKLVDLTNLAPTTDEKAENYMSKYYE